jgi:hypothetical protein
MNYQLLLQECKQIITEYGFTSRWAVIEGYHALGKRITEENITETSLVTLTKDINRSISQFFDPISLRTVQRSVQFYKKYPNLELLPEGKNTSWHKVINKYLPETVTPKEKKLHKCPKCGYEW